MRLRLFTIPSPVGKLAILPAPGGDASLANEISSVRRAGVDALVSLLTDDECRDLHLGGESDACIPVGIEFIRYPIEDRAVPRDEAKFQTFIEQLTNRLKEGRFLAIHCRAGIGRSSLVAACLLGSLGIDAASAFSQISRARGCPVPDTEEQEDWVKRFVKGWGQLG